MAMLVPGHDCVSAANTSVGSTHDGSGVPMLNIDMNMMNVITIDSIRYDNNDQIFVVVVVVVVVVKEF
jgi:hypothetical protein